MSALRRKAEFIQSGCPGPFLAKRRHRTGLVDARNRRSSAPDDAAAVVVCSIISFTKFLLCAE
jgi:hypothetical protein